MDHERIYVLTDRGSALNTRWIVCELRDPEDHSCHGLIIHKQIYYTNSGLTITYRTETSADFPISREEMRRMQRIMFDNDDLWRNDTGTHVEPKALKHVIGD